MLKSLRFEAFLGRNKYGQIPYGIFEARFRLTLTVNGLRLNEHQTFPIKFVMKRDSTDLGVGPNKVECPYPVTCVQQNILKPAAGSSEQRDKTAERPSCLEAATVAAFNLQEEKSHFLKNCKPIHK